MNKLLAAIVTVAALVSTAAQQASAGDAPTQADCIQANASCEGLMYSTFGALNAPAEIAKQCAPAFQACTTRAAAAAAAATPAPAPAPAPAATPAPAPTEAPKMTATVLLDVDVYDVPGGIGKVIGILEKDLEVTLVEPCEDNWCHVEGEGVPTGIGFVYSGPDYLSLQF
jgi:pyruvate/2-oxoglutarate dehydrogenase complex dihydrolipoamide acyltransferase (E2) component